jgi:putative endonuclease
MKQWYVYMVQTEKGKFYTGISTDVERRFVEHLTGLGGAKALKGDPAQALVYVEDALNRSAASQREYAIKKMSRKEKEKLVYDFELFLSSSLDS